MTYLDMKKLIESLFPKLSASYREWRDRRIFSAQVMRPTELGFDFIGDTGMPESRMKSGEVTALRELLQDKDLFVDVGANCGLYSLIAAKAGVAVVAIEPNPLNFIRLKQNIAHNRIEHVEARALALSDNPGRAVLYGGGQGASLLRNWGGMASTYAQEVEVDTLDILLGSRPSSNRILIKIDVEGHEPAVLAGARHMLRREAAPTWIIEHSFRENQDGGINPRFLELFELFWGLDYECFTFQTGRKRVRRDDVERWVRFGSRDFGDINYVFIKK